MDKNNFKDCYTTVSLLISSIENDIYNNRKARSFKGRAQKFLNSIQESIKTMKTPLQEVYDECRFLSENLEVSHLENEKSIKKISEEFKQKEGQMKEMPANYEKELVSLQGQIAKLSAEALIAEEVRATDKPRTIPKTKQPKKICGD